MFNPADKLLERYEIVEKVGEGGMGFVYKAQDINLERHVAIKVLRPEIASDRKSIRNLKQEAKTAAGLQHQNIAAIYDLSEWQGHHLIIMEFVAGKTLEDVILDNYPLPLEQVLDMTIQICTGLQYIHAHQVYHRDIKPKNIMVTANGLVKITDFGISHVVQQSMSQKSVNVYTSGTLSYMSPEQCESKPTDARSDIYAFGITLYEILTQDPPFLSGDISFQHLHVKPQLMTERKPSLNVPLDLNAIVMKCLEKDPVNRYATVRELQTSLESLHLRLSDADKIPELIERARSEQSVENYQTAIQIWERVLAIEPDNKEAKSGVVYAQGILSKQQAAKEKQTKIEGLLHEAKEQSNVKNDEKVVEIFRKILELDPDNAAAKYGLENALKSSTAKRIHDDDRQAKIQSLSRQAQDAWSTENYRKVMEFGQQILELDPDNTPAQLGIESAKKSLAVQQREREHLIQQAQEKEQAGNFKEAIQHWEQVLKTDPENQIAKYGLEIANKSLAAQQQRERDNLVRQAQDEKQRRGTRGLQRAIQLLRKALWLDPENQIVKSEVENAEKTLAGRIKERDSFIAQAQEGENKGELEAAIQFWEKVLEIDPEYQLAQSRIELAKKILAEEEKRENKERELQIQKTHQRQAQIQALITQAQNEERAGNLPNAIQIWQNVLQFAPENKIAQTGLARTQALWKQASTTKKIDYAVAAASLFIAHLHREGFDYGLIATFGDSLRIEQDFTSDSDELQLALSRIRQSVGGRTRLYDSIEDVVNAFWQIGAQDRPWLLIIITDGIDNESQKYSGYPAGIGRYVATRFMHEQTNFVFLIGVGTGKEIDANALITLGKTGGFPATTIAAFPMLERLFLEIALQVSQRLVGRRINIGNLSWEEIAREYQVSQVPLDYAFLIDRSSSMNEPG